jgi:Membrane-fusion protein
MPPQTTPEVGVVTLKSQPVSVVSDLTGRTTAALSAEVRPQVGGIIEKRLFNEGDTVKAGQALYQIDASSYRAAYNEAAAALKQAQALVTADCQKAKRYAQLVKDNGVSRQDARRCPLHLRTGHSQRGIEKCRPRQRPHQSQLDHGYRADCRADWHFVGHARRAGDGAAGHRPGNYSRAG